VSIPLFQNSTFRSQAQSIANLSGAVVNLILIMAMSRVYEKLAFRLTSWGKYENLTYTALPQDPLMRLEM